MRFSRAFIPTQREVPAEAELISHKLLLRAGYMRKLASGIYSWLPLGHKVVQKISALVREECEKIGAQELLLPALQPRELWEETGRSGVDVLFHLKDRGNRDLLLGMTHEEVATDIIRGGVRSYRQLPIVIYQIQTKFRDEPRPRGGVVRGREFITHDCYSFHTSLASLDQTYLQVHKCYNRVLKRLGLEYLEVEAEAGAASGSLSHAFVVLVDSGEDTVLISDDGSYAATADRCEIGPAVVDETPEPDTMKLVNTPGKRTVDEVTNFLQIAAEKLIKTLIYQTYDGRTIAALVRGDRELNPAKLSRALGGAELVLASPEVIEKVSGASVGYAGPVNLKENIPIIADQELKCGANWVTGANEDDAHLLNVNEGRDFEVEQWADIRMAEDGDPCPRGAGTLEARHGIELAHIFKLGSRYGEIMNAKYLDKTGKEQPVILGSYGFGVTRAVAAVAEQFADADGLIWPASIAPYDVILLCLNVEEDGVAAGKLYEELKSEGLDVLFDDRAERAGVKFKDADLLGIPIQVVVGKGARDGKVEIRLRGRAEKREATLAMAATEISKLHASLIAELEENADLVDSPAF